jgi:hypothetical protein
MVSDVLDSVYLPIVFNILDHVRTRNLSDSVEKFTYWEWFQRLVSDLISPGNEINCLEDGDEAARNFTASIASAYMLSANRVTLSDLNNDLPGLRRLLQHKQKPRNSWHEPRNPPHKSAVNWVSQ